MKSGWRSAGLAGSIAGVIMLLPLAVGARYAGLDWDSPIRWIASVLMSEPALIVAGQAQGGISAAACLGLGLVIHLAAAIVFARLFLMAVNTVTGRRLLLIGVGYGAAIWAIMNFGFLSVFNDVMYARVRLQPGLFLAAHLVYGMVLGGVLFVQRRESREQAVHEARSGSAGDR
jgi:hypothetical protein